MSFPEDPDPLTGKAPEHEKNALKAHAQELEKTWGKSSITPSDRIYSISWKDLSGSQSWGIKDLLKNKYNIISNISTDWDAYTNNYIVNTVKDNPLTIEEARIINNDIDDIYKVIGTIFGLSSSGSGTSVETEEQKLERINIDAINKLLETHEARRKKIISQKEKIFTIPNDITEKVVLSSIGVTKLDIVTLNIISKHKDTSQWLEKTSRIAEDIIKSKKDAGYKIETPPFPYPSDDYIKNLVTYEVKSILLKIFDEMDKQAKPIPTDEEKGMQQTTWASSHKDSKPKIKKIYECYFCKKRGMELKFDNYVELKNHIESVHKLRREPGLKGQWVPITGTPQIKTKEEQVKELEDEVIDRHKKPNETWIYVPMVEVAKLVRNVLKIYFPNQKFSVRKSGGSAIYVNWSGVPSEIEVESVVGKYHSSEFDAMHDTTISLNRPWGNSYIFIKKQGD